MLKKIQFTTMYITSTARHEYSRILSAAVINANFRSMLLADPIKAVARGYSGEQFKLGGDDKQRLASIHAKSLADFAAELSNS